MKQSILLVLLFSSIIGMGQKPGQIKQGYGKWIDPPTIYWDAPLGSGMGQWQTPHSDTIEILLPLQIHYIKIGARIWRMQEHNPYTGITTPGVFWFDLKCDSTYQWSKITGIPGVPNK